MATGYTCHIQDGVITTGKDFLTKCIRAFGCCIDMKEDSLDTPVTLHKEPDTYHKEQLEKYKNELNEFLNISDEEIQKQLNKEYEGKIKSAKQSIKKCLELKEKYQSVLIEVRRWVPPTSEHEGIKKFAIEQIESSIDFDCNTKCSEEALLSPKQSLEEYKKTRLESIQWSINYHQEKWHNEIERAKNRVKFLKKFFDSLENL